MSLSELPPLDCHAHIAPDVTRPQIAGLKGALVFAMTRTPGEARAAARRADATLAWGFGAHPGLPDAINRLDDAALHAAVDAHVVMGEIGLDRRGPDGPQRDALEAILGACHGQPVLLSLHSTGRTGQLLDVLREKPHPGAVLHWFNGTPNEISEAIALGCYFSVNNAMSDDRLAQIPTDKCSLRPTSRPPARSPSPPSPATPAPSSSDLPTGTASPRPPSATASTAPSVAWPPLPGSGRGCLKPSRKPSTQPGSRRAAAASEVIAGLTRAYRMSRAARAAHVWQVATARATPSHRHERVFQ